MMKMNLNFLKNRKFKHGSLATIVTVVFIAAIVVINVIATTLLERYPLTVDLTEDKRFELTDESIDYVKTLTSDVKITVCAEEAVFKSASDLYRQAYEIISGYTKHNSEIKLEFIDLIKNPTFAQGYPEFTLNIGDIIIESPLRSKKVTGSDIFSAQQTEAGGQVYSSQAEQAMTSALTYVTDENPATVAVLGGMDNADISGYIELLEKNNFSVTQKDLLVDEIEQETDFVILPAPAADISAEQVKKLNAYLDNDGKFDKSLIYISSRLAPAGPVLKSFLAEWGIDPGAEVLFETDTAFAVQNNLTMINQVRSEELAGKLKSTTLPLIVPIANPINVLFSAKDNRKTEVLVATSEGVVLFPVDAADDFDPSKQPKNSYPTIVKASRNKYDQTTLLSSSIIAIGSELMLDQSFLQNPSYNNADVIMSITNGLVAKEDTIRILPINFTDENITITQQQSSTLLVIFMILIPLLVLIIGTVIWFRRRHL